MGGDGCPLDEKVAKKRRRAACKDGATLVGWCPSEGLAVYSHRIMDRDRALGKLELEAGAIADVAELLRADARLFKHSAHHVDGRAPLQL